jgi:hypothetical protein
MQAWASAQTTLVSDIVGVDADAASLSSSSSMASPVGSSWEFFMVDAYAVDALHIVLCSFSFVDRLLFSETCAFSKQKDRSLLVPGKQVCGLILLVHQKMILAESNNLHHHTMQSFMFVTIV